MLEVVLSCDLVPGQSFGAGQDQIAFIVSLCVLRVPRLRAGEPGRFISLGWLGSSRHCVGQNFRIWARLRCRRFKFRNVFHVGPYDAPAEAVRRSFEELSNCNAVERCGGVGGQSGDFKLPAGGAANSRLIGCTASGSPVPLRLRPAYRVAGNGEVWRIGLRHPVNDGAVLHQRI